MEGKNIPPIITLSASMIACVICIVREASLYTTLKIVLAVMAVFFIIGLIAQKILVKIDRDAEEAALERQRIEQELAARELEEAELAKQAEETATKENVVREDMETAEAVTKEGSEM